MTPEDEKFERIAQRHIADLKKSSKSIVEDATVRAVQKVMAEFAQGAHTEAKTEYHTKMIQCPHCDGPVRVPAQPYPDNFIDALKYDVAKRDSEAQQAYEDAFINGTGVMLGDKRIDPASIYKEPEQEPVSLKSLAKKAGINLPETYIPTMDDAIAAGDSVLMNEQAALLLECRMALDHLLRDKPMLAAKVCGTTTLGNLRAMLHEYRPQGVFGGMK